MAYRHQQQWFACSEWPDCTDECVGLMDDRSRGHRWIGWSEWQERDHAEQHNQNQEHVRPAEPTQQQTQKQQDQAAVAGAASPRQSFDLEHFRIVNKYHGPWKSQYEVLIWIHDSRGDPLGLGQYTFSNNEAEEVPEIIS